MRYVLTGLLGAALLFGCGDDDGDKPAPVDSGAKDSGAGTDSGIKDAGPTGSMDASTTIDGGPKDAGPTGDSGVTSASATLASKSGSSVTGKATFSISGKLVTLKLEVSGAEPGQRGAHIHQTPDCSAVDGASAGAHWNPANHVHGSGTADAGAISHLGDLGNITIAGDGKGTLEISKPEWTLGDGAATDVIGHAVIVHKNTDDLVTNASDAGPGMSGARLACGVIAK
jgi:superoxide dismutase, Cu-Zn family